MTDNRAYKMITEHILSSLEALSYNLHHIDLYVHTFKERIPNDAGIAQKPFAPCTTERDIARPRRWHGPTTQHWHGPTTQRWHGPATVVQVHLGPACQRTTLGM